MRLAARAAIAGLAIAVSGMAAACSAAPGLAYDQRATRPAATATRATVPTSAQGKTRPAGLLAVAGAPKDVKAKAGVLVDVTTGQVLWDRDANVVRPIASITKVMTALVVMRAASPNQAVTVPRSVTDYVARYGANSAGLIPGQVLTVDELMHAMLMESAADAAYTLASTFGPGLPGFIAKMNAAAARLGLAHTHFTSPDGLPYPSATSTYSTPAELVRLGDVAMGYPEFRSIVGLRYYNIPKAAGHTAYSLTTSNDLIGRFPGVIGIKTGFTQAAGHTLLFEAIRGDRVLIGDVLGSPPTGPDSGAKDAAQVLTWGFALKPST